MVLPVPPISPGIGKAAVLAVDFAPELSGVRSSAKRRLPLNRKYK
jgi:hypothetical protein